MMKRVIIAGLVAATIGCGDKSSPTAPGTGTGSGTLVRVQITGPVLMAPGTVTPFKLMAFYGPTFPYSQNDVTSQATWTSSNPDVIRVEGGQATALQDGESGITGQFGGMSARVVVTVLEPGTFFIIGLVEDYLFGLAGARVEVIAGTGAGKVTTTDAGGRYKLFGVAGTIEVRASLDGYQSATHSIIVGSSGSPSNVAFSLLPSGVPVDLSGAWDLTFEASASCTALADVARRRTYIATIEQSGSALTVRLSGAQFAPDPAYGSGYFEDNFRARVNGDAVTLKLDTYEYYGTHYDVGELIPNNGVLTIAGKGAGTATASTISGTLDGVFTLGGPGSGSNAGSCARADHRFTFLRRTMTSGRRR